MAASGSARTRRSPTSAASARTSSKALRDIKVPNVRWPGGCFADEYHWRHGIGPIAGRRKTINSNWGGAVEPNTFGTDEFMDFVGQIGSEAYVSVNVGSGTVEEAAEWVEYMTADPETTAGKERAANGHPSPTRSSTWASATRAGAAAARCARSTMPTR
jgi:alpha-N-arabinofuranosidase